MTFSKTQLTSSLLLSILWGCGTESNSSQVQSCRWVYQVGSGDLSVEYSASCVVASQGQLSQEHCESKYKGTFGEACPSDSTVLDCENIALSTDSDVSGKAYIYDKALLNIYQLRADFDSISVCEAISRHYLE